MAAIIREAEIAWKDSVNIKLGFSGLEPEHALPIMRQIVRDSWPEIRRPSQCVYVIPLER